MARKRASLGISSIKVGLWIKTDGTTEQVMPDKGKKFTLKEVQDMVGGYVERIKLPGKKVLLVNEEGLIRNLPLNAEATLLLGTPIVGDVVLLPPGMGW